MRRLWLVDHRTLLKKKKQPPKCVRGGNGRGSGSGRVAGVIWHCLQGAGGRAGRGWANAKVTLVRVGVN